MTPPWAKTPQRMRPDNPLGTKINSHTVSRVAWTRKQLPGTSCGQPSREPGRPVDHMMVILGVAVHYGTAELIQITVHGRCGPVTCQCRNTHDMNLRERRAA